MTVRLRDIDESNFYQILSMHRPKGEKYVAPNSISLAEAWLYRDEHTVRPLAVYDDDELVGFTMTHDDRTKNIRDIWRILIPEEYVNHGYGSQTIQLLAERARTDGFVGLRLSYVPGNALAEHVYRKSGFVPTGAIDDGEIVMERPICG
ncbi:GNAT family N-acetyltransferase [Bifidobacterium sp. ESL0784]|uniref:GNAT family N-acetyltransferase n=1 Tax=Bifidobacterium sp. ESL0784 TaxID=2983231 RepID=UPI0023F96ED7|nr:GNAT family N-acetyltransferase [Bifidobacterium sp. ESL0784]MDF7640124.1 GNAT family N-acetyltransferase [Bifidobacterium sp. ESL0784]